MPFLNIKVDCLFFEKIMNSSMNITFIANPISGGKRNKIEILEFVKAFFTGKVGQLSIKMTSGRGEATVLAQAAIENGSDVVVAVGGDGTVNEIASALVNTNAILGIIPCGSGNGLARSLHISQNLQSACQLIERGFASPIDVGKANDHYFVLLAGLGFDAVVGKRFDENSKRGPLPYFYLGVKEYFNYRPERVKVRVQDKLQEIDPFLIAVANGQQYGNGALIAPAAKLNDGLLDICVVHSLTFMQLFSALPKLFSGNIQEYGHADFFTSPSITIERDAPGLVNLDGEPVLLDATVKISLLPKSLNVIASSNSSSLN